MNKAILLSYLGDRANADQGRVKELEGKVKELELEILKLKLSNKEKDEDLQVKTNFISIIYL